MTAHYLARRQRIIIIRRFCMVFIIMLGIFTMTWASTIHRRQLRQQSKQQTTIAMDHLIIIPGHAIQQCSNIVDLQDDRDQCWYLLDYQRGQHRLFLEHINTGLRLHEQDRRSLLMFSGGQTRQAVGPISEAQSYKEAAMLVMQSKGRPFKTDRWAVEEFARDSFENLAFSLCRYKQIVNRWPDKVTVVGFPFKEPRFRQLHWETIKTCIDKEIVFEYVGVDVEGVDQRRLVDDAYPLFELDPFGDGGVLAEKRKSRNPFGQKHAYDCFPFLK